MLLVFALTVSLNGEVDTIVRVGEVAMGVEQKSACGVIS